MDIGLLRGDMDGIEAAQAIRSRIGSAIIYMTGYADPTIRKQSEATDPPDYLIQPVDGRTIHDTIQAVYSNR